MTPSGLGSRLWAQTPTPRLMIVIKEWVYVGVNDQAGALAAIRTLAGRETVRDAVGCHFAFVDPRRTARATSLVGLLYAWRWLPSVDDEGNIEALEFTGEKEGDEDILFQAIAPWVRDGSFIVAASEDKGVWRWLFEGGEVRRQAATLSFEE